MKRSIMAVTVLLMVLFAVSCGDDSKNDTDWGNQDNEVTDEDAGDTGDTGNEDADISDTSDESEQPDLSDESDQSDESGEDADAENPDEDTAVDPLLAQFIGTWAQKIILKSSSSSMIVNVPSVTIRYILVDMTVKNGKLEINKVLS